jgi:tetratricopeptide (TPR) repeat protein
MFPPLKLLHSNSIMPTDLKTLEARALDLMKRSDFGTDAVRANREILEQAPTNAPAWTRLGRCYLEQREFDEAVAALRSALSLNPANSVATNLLNEVRKRRAMTPTATARATTGFTAREFTILETLPADQSSRTLQPRIEALFDAINATSTAAKIVETRRREREPGTKLFHANSFHSHASGHLYAFHQGGRWEPQFNIGWFSSPPFFANCVRIGLGFNFAVERGTPEPGSASERALALFARFQQIVARSWTRQLAEWMADNSGFIQYGRNPPATDLLPAQAVDWLVKCQNAAALEWVFVGRWLFLDRADDAKILADRASLARIVDDTFRALLPIWLSTYQTGSED